MSEERDFSSEEETFLGKDYKVESILGEGSFGVVAKCSNIRTNEQAAIKVIKNRANAFQLARQEVAILKRLPTLDPEKSCFVQWKGFFFHENTNCIIFELLDQNLAEYINETCSKEVPMAEIGSILYQLSTALSHLSSKRIVHADLKARNVMVVDRHQKPLRVKLIDFGVARLVSDCWAGMRIGTRRNRAPEVTLGCKFNEAADMWSLGTVAAELATGFPLYPGKNNYDVLKYITETQGQLPVSVLKQGRYTSDFYCRVDGPERWRLMTPEEFKSKTGDEHSDNRHYTLDNLVDLLDNTRGPSKKHAQLVDLIEKMMQLKPKQRIKPLEVQQHLFVSDSLQQSGITNEPASVDPQQDQLGPDNILAEEPEDMSREDMQPGTMTIFYGWICSLGRGIMDKSWSFYYWLSGRVPKKQKNCAGMELEGDTENAQCRKTAGQEDPIEEMMHLEPDQRIKPLEVQQHLFVSDSLQQRSITNEPASVDPQQPSHQPGGPDKTPGEEPEDRSREDMQPGTMATIYGGFRSLGKGIIDKSRPFYDWLSGRVPKQQKKCAGMEFEGDTENAQCRKTVGQEDLNRGTEELNSGRNAGWSNTVMDVVEALMCFC